MATTRPLPRALSRRELVAPAELEVAASLLPPPTLAVLALHRMGLGPVPGDATLPGSVAYFNALGGNDDQRLAAYVAQQTNPGPDNQDTVYWQRRNGTNGFPAPGFTTLGKTLGQLWTDHRVGGLTPSRPVEEVRLDTLMRMTYSRWQLRELMVDFWMNHFNVYGFESYTQETFVHWNRDVIRAHAFGNFRQMLEAVTRSTTMLYYLDNYTNTVAGPNENWARELFELHALGAENYEGILDPTAVPQDGVWPPGGPRAGLPLPRGYVDNDVYEAARSFTGWSVAGATGLFEYNAANHDRFAKSVLAFGVQNLPADQAPEKDGEDVLDLISAHPGTGRHIVRKLCRRLVADDPPASLVDPVAELFTSLWSAPDQMKQVVTEILLSPEFRASWGLKVKRPIEWTVSALRATGADFLFGYSSQSPLTVETDTASLLSRQTRTGQGLFARVPPDGFPDKREAWGSSNTRVQCWRLAGWIVDQRDETLPSGRYRTDIVGITLASLPSGQRSANQIVDLWIGRLLERPMDLVDRGEIVDFLAAGGSGDAQLDLTSSSVAARLRSMAALLLMTPDFFLK